MANQATLAHHAALMDRMASRVGVDLEEKVMRAELRPDELVDMVLSCTNCSCPGACAKFLDASVSDVGTQAPGYCRNADVFDELKRG